MAKKITVLLAILGLAIVISAGSAFAEWKLWFEFDSESEIKSIYVDLSTVKHNNSGVSAWVLWNLREPIVGRVGWRFGVKTMSISEYTKFDCEQSRVKVLSSRLYSGTMQSGDLNDTLKESDWKYPSPDSTRYQVLQSACRNLK